MKVQKGHGFAQMCVTLWSHHHEQSNFRKVSTNSRSNKIPDGIIGSIQCGCVERAPKRRSFPKSHALTDWLMRTLAEMLPNSCDKIPWIQQLEYTIAPPVLCALDSITKNPDGDISGTKRGIIDPRVSKQQEKCFWKNSDKTKNTK